jgi:preprotein translocase subunit SecG
MVVFHTLLMTLQVIAALGIIGLVLIQHGKGADAGAGFGGGSSASLFGATGGANALSKLTAICTAVFFVCTLGLAYIGGSRVDASGTSVLQRAAGAAPAVQPASGAASSAPATLQIPTSAVPAPTASAVLVAPGVAPVAVPASAAASK